jgi:putative phosphotransacetylase
VTETLNRNQLETLVKELMTRMGSTPTEEDQELGISVGISNRHIHLCQEDVEALFGSGYQLTIKKWLKQPGQYATAETVTIVGPKGSLANVRVLGPTREKSQLEISKTDSFALGVKAPINESGDLTHAGAVCVLGPKGMVTLKQNVIVAKRHIHMSPMDAAKFNVVNKQLVAIKTSGEREMIFMDTVIRVDDNFRLECHLDTDEANAASLKNGSKVTIIDNL